MLHRSPREAHPTELLRPEVFEIQLRLFNFEPYTYVPKEVPTPTTTDVRSVLAIGQKCRLQLKTTIKPLTSRRHRARE
jgi:hypothetical protein